MMYRVLSSHYVLLNQHASIDCTKFEVGNTGIKENISLTNLCVTYGPGYRLNIFIQGVIQMWLDLEIFMIRE